MIRVGGQLADAVFGLHFVERYMGQPGLLTAGQKASGRLLALRHIRELLAEGTGQIRLDPDTEPDGPLAEVLADVGGDELDRASDLAMVLAGFLREPVAVRLGPEKVLLKMALGKSS